MEAMNSILPQVRNPAQHHEYKLQPTEWPTCCSRCGSLRFKKHGCYKRKVRLDNKSQAFNPVQIQRFYCNSCERTFSMLPEGLPPRRWYVWSVQQLVLLAYLISPSQRWISRQYQMARSTIRRWLWRLKEQFIYHYDQLKQHIPDILGRTYDFKTFWQTSLSQFSLAQAMYHLSLSGIAIP